ncbi:esterase-like activity of phytase family protein [Streptomyces sp.]|uniref:esterase-like activity of phytase family protein n=1 Tax=Streptomyces sp. TaxID=1931 RepID=UPI002F3FF896
MHPRLISAATSLLVAASCLTLTAPTADADTDDHGGNGPTANACSPWTTIDGFSDALDKTTFDGAVVGELSGLAVDTDGHLVTVSDKSSMLTLDSRTRQPTSVLPLADENDARLDSEAVVVDADGTRLVTSEIDSSVRRYSRNGELIGRLRAAAELQVAPAGRATRNLTFEGLALQPGGRTLIASMEGALTGDDADLRRFQTWQRVQRSTDFRLGAQHAYRADAGLDISDISPADDGRLLVLERGYTPNVGNTVRLYLADPGHASDVSDIENLTGQHAVRIVRKTLLADIGDCPSLGAAARQPQPNPLLDNIEGVTVTGRTPDGRLRLLLVSDDNGRADQITRLYDLTTRLPRR